MRGIPSFLLFSLLFLIISLKCAFSSVESTENEIGIFAGPNFTTDNKYILT